MYEVSINTGKIILFIFIYFYKNKDHKVAQGLIIYLLSFNAGKLTNSIVRQN